MSQAARTKTKMKAKADIKAETKTVEMDVRDVQRRVGQEVGGGQLVDPCASIDIRRWAMAMDDFWRG